jgi:hypothetical protein
VTDGRIVKLMSWAREYVGKLDGDMSVKRIGHLIDDEELLPTDDGVNWSGRLFRQHFGRGCSRKKRSISRAASGPRGTMSVIVGGARYGGAAKRPTSWDRMTKLVADWLPPPRILHPWPDQRFAVKHLR